MGAGPVHDLSNPDKYKKRFDRTPVFGEMQALFINIRIVQTSQTHNTG